ncbi:UNVERIFIED_CONTAM: hypothetical protein Sradi_3022200 [Sesamum radiatum]|uniref:Retrotransposon gag domain-containing protein n=1 Tax=Sesamum radiatum TaxID=300843 RepID=A0AAW2S1I6_SESRA
MMSGLEEEIKIEERIAKRIDVFDLMPYQPKYHKYTPLSTTRAREMMMVEKERLLQWPRKMRDIPAKRFSNKYCRFHKDKGHDIEECYQLKDEIEKLVRQGYFKHLILERREEQDTNQDKRSRSRSADKFRKSKEERAHENAPSKGTIHTILGGPTGGDPIRAQKKYARSFWRG